MKGNRISKWLSSLCREEGGRAARTATAPGPRGETSGAHGRCRPATLAARRRGREAAPGRRSVCAAPAALSPRALRGAVVLGGGSSRGLAADVPARRGQRGAQRAQVAAGRAVDGTSRGPAAQAGGASRCHRWHRVGARVAVAGSAPPLRASCGRSLTAAGLCVRSRPCFLCTTCVRHFGAQDQPRDRRQRASALRSSQGLAFAAAPRVSSPRAGPAARGAGLRGHVALQCLACRLQADWQHERLAR